jgi:hypothetical protein
LAGAAAGVAADLELSEALDDEPLSADDEEPLSDEELPPSDVDDEPVVLGVVLLVVDRLSFL